MQLWGLGMMPAAGEAGALEALLAEDVEGDMAAAASPLPFFWALARCCRGPGISTGSVPATLPP